MAASLSRSAFEVRALERSARLAGECFAHEEVYELEREGFPIVSPLLWSVAAIAACAGLAVLALR